MGADATVPPRSGPARCPPPAKVMNATSLKPIAVIACLDFLLFCAKVFSSVAAPQRQA
jgi:hypothetical protein